MRTPDEWKDTGVAKGAARIDMNQPGGAAGFVDEVLKRTKGDKNAPVALICRSGNRSTQMQSLLQTRPENLDDLTVQVALIRPGPVSGGAVHPYVAHRRARRGDMADAGRRQQRGHRDRTCRQQG